MFDTRIRPVIDPTLDRIGHFLARRGWTADGITIAGFALGVLAAGALAAGWHLAGLILVLLNRMADGLDGAVARAAGRTDRGGFLDITLDFAFYGLVPLAFAVSDPIANALPAAFLLAAFYVNGAAFLAFAAVAGQRGLTTDAQGQKSLYYLAGIAEGAETILVFAAMCILPGWFPVLAVGFGCVTAISAVARIIAGGRALR